MAVIVGADTEVGAAIAQRYHRAGTNLIAVVRGSSAQESARASGPASEHPGPLAPAANPTRVWDPRSPLAARSLVLELTVSAPLELCIVVEDPSVLAPQRLHEAHLFDIDRVVDEHLKSYAFLLRELLRHRAEAAQVAGTAGSRGRLAVVRTLVAGTGGTFAPLNACVVGALGALVNALSSSADLPGTDLAVFEPVAARSGDDPLADAAARTAYADFVVDTLETEAAAGVGRHRFRPGRRRLPLF